MGAADLEAALDRAQRALDRIESAVASSSASERDEQLRARVRETLGQLDEMIREAEANG